MVLGERLEYRSDGDGEDAAALWEAQGWIGGDLRRLCFKTEGEYDFAGDTLEEAELQVLYSRAVRPFWDLQAGLRVDHQPNPSRSYAVFGVQGTAPYWFELDAALFLSDQGRLSARLEAEYELLLTQRLILQPRLEIEVAAAADEAIGVGEGLSSATAGLRLRYAVTPELAPYLGLSWSRSFGATADLADGSGGSETQLVAGVRFWF